MTEPNKSDLLNQTLEMPIKEAKNGILSSYLQLILTVSQVMKDLNYSSTDPRPNDIIDLIISIIPNVKKQKSLREKRDKRILEEIKNIDTNEEKGRKIQQIYREILGEVAQYMDLYTGGERRNRISFVIPIKEMRDIMEAANPQHFEEHVDEDIEVSPED